MSIAVTTPTGTVGRHVVAALIRAGVRPRVLVRDPDRLAPAVRDRVDAVRCDLTDDVAVLAATSGVRALYWVDPPAESPDPVAMFEALGATAARAVAENGIARVVFQSSIGAELRSGAGEIDGLARTEQLLDAAGAAVTHLRCGFFFTNLLFDLDAVRSGRLEVLLDPDVPLPWVAPRDIAEVAAAWLLRTDWTGRTAHGVHGPRDLSWSQAADVVSAATGRPLSVVRVADDVVRARLRDAGLTLAAVEAVVGMSTGLRDGFVPEPPRDLTTTTPTELGGWAWQELRPLL